MASKKPVEIGLLFMKRASLQTGVKVPAATGGTRYQTGQCGIDPYEPPAPPPPAIPEKFPEELMRPPCLPGHEGIRHPPDCGSLSGVYCPPQRIKYKYPPFSENINFVPSGEEQCWWVNTKKCEGADNEEEIPIKF